MRPDNRRWLLDGNRRQRDRRRAAKALGRPLKRSEPVHHHTLTQIVICEDVAYHALLHRRERIIRLGGNPNTDAICAWCHNARPMAGFDYLLGEPWRCEYCTLGTALECAIHNAHIEPWEPWAQPATWGGKTAQELGVMTVYEKDRAAFKAQLGRVW